MSEGQNGQLSIFVVLLVVPLMALGGLIVDGGGVLAAHQRAITVAFEAARAGAQQIDVDSLRSTGVVVLDPVAARSAALAYLSGAGATGTVEVNGRSVTVTVTEPHSFTILSIFGLGPVNVSGTSTATATPGIAGAGT